jgi:hypothetical protein
MASHRLLERENGNLIEQLFAADKQIRNVMRSQVVLKPSARDAERGGCFVHGQWAVRRVRGAQRYLRRDVARFKSGRGTHGSTPDSVARQNAGSLAAERTMISLFALTSAGRARTRVREIADDPDYPAENCGSDVVAR